MNKEQHLYELLRTVIADGDFGITLHSDEPVVVHSRNGSEESQDTQLTHDEIAAFLRRLLGSRGVREFRDRGVTRFMVPFDNGTRLIGAARQDEGVIHVEVRRMAGRSR